MLRRFMSFGLTATTADDILNRIFATFCIGK